MTIRKIERRAITGSELKKIIINEMTNHVSRNPQPKSSLTFHKAQVEWAYRITAFPADVPVPPEVEDIFNALPPDFSEKDFIQYQSDREVLRKIMESIEIYLKKTEEVVIEEEGIESAGDRPDELRIKHNLPVLEKREVAGRLVEVEIEMDNEVKLNV